MSSLRQLSPALRAGAKGGTSHPSGADSAGDIAASSPRLELKASYGGAVNSCL
jgi:hypothetical protein